MTLWFQIVVTCLDAELPVLSDAELAYHKDLKTIQDNTSIMHEKQQQVVTECTLASQLCAASTTV